MDPIRQFEQERQARIETYKDDHEFQKLSHSWLMTSMMKKYVYNFAWMGRPIIQNPIDMVGTNKNRNHYGKGDPIKNKSIIPHF